MNLIDKLRLQGRYYRMHHNYFYPFEYLHTGSEILKNILSPLVDT